MLVEDQVAARLRAGVDDIQAATDLAATVRRRHARRMRTRTMVGTTAAALVVGVTAVTAFAGAPTTPDRQNVAYVTEHAVAALDAASDKVMHARGELLGQTVEQWRDPTGSRWRADEVGPDGKPRRAMLVTGPDNGDQTALAVDYASRTWWSHRLDPQNPRYDVSMITVGDGPVDLRDMLQRLGLHVAGTGKVDGHEVIHLSGEKPTGDGIAVDFWIDRTTYLPVRFSMVSPGNSTTSRYEWLPRTAENLAPFDLTPPAGFTQRQYK